MAGDTETSARESSAFSRNLEAGPATTIGRMGRDGVDPLARRMGMQATRTGAFRNPDDSTVLVAHNENDNPSTFAVREGDQAFTYTLPGGALATFTWRGQVPGTYALRQVSPSGWTATANPAGRQIPDIWKLPVIR